MLIKRIAEVFDYQDGGLKYKIAQGSKSAGAIAGTRNKGYWQVGLDGKRYQAHRIIFAMHHGFLPEQVDHIDGDKLNNKIENLRQATNAQNHWNTGIRSTNKSGVKGVCWNKQSRKWRALCRVNGRQQHVGDFATIQDAEAALTVFRLNHHGQFARSAAHGIVDITAQQGGGT